MFIKKYLRLYLINLLAIKLTGQLVAGFSYGSSFNSLAWVTLIFLFAEVVLKPLANLLLLPINLITLGLFRWLINVLVLYAVTKITPLLQITPFYFSGFESGGFIFPATDISYLGALIISSFCLSLISSFVIWLIKK